MNMFLLLLLLTRMNQSGSGNQSSHYILREDGLNILSVGEPFDVILDENPSMGYYWSNKNSDSDVIKLLSTDQIPGDKSFGGSCIREWQFTANHKGRHRMTFRLNRPDGMAMDVKVYDLLVK